MGLKKIVLIIPVINYDPTDSLPQELQKFMARSIFVKLFSAADKMKVVKQEEKFDYFEGEDNVLTGTYDEKIPNEDQVYLINKIFRDNSKKIWREKKKIGKNYKFDICENHNFFD